MTPFEASVAHEVLKLFFDIVRRECWAPALQAQGISEDMVTNAMAALERTADDTLPATPAAKRRREP